MEIKTSELTGPVLDWAVAKCEGQEEEYLVRRKMYPSMTGGPSNNWALGGPIIEREKIQLVCSGDGEWIAKGSDCQTFFNVVGASPLIAAMRCFVGTKLGRTVEIPNELVTEKMVMAYAEKTRTLPSDIEQSSQIGSGKWYVQSGYDDHIYSGPYDTEKEAQREIDTDPEQAGGVPCQVEEPELSTLLNVGKFADYVNTFASEHQFSVSDWEIGEVIGGRDKYPVAGALEGKVLALAEFDDVGVVFQSKGRGEARVFIADTLSRVPAVGEMMKVEWKDGKGVVLPLVAEKVLGR